jgi:hypothetical protein
MPTPFESAHLNLQLCDLRRGAVLREARNWFLLEFNPETFAELIATVSGPRNSAFRMVVTLLGRRMERFLRPSARSIRFFLSCAPQAAKGTFASTWKRLFLQFPMRKACCRVAEQHSVRRPKREPRKRLGLRAERCSRSVYPPKVAISLADCRAPPPPYRSPWPATDRGSQRRFARVTRTLVPSTAKHRRRSIQRHTPWLFSVSS